jgi:hypothetical protein
MKQDMALQMFVHLRGTELVPSDKLTVAQRVKKFSSCYAEPEVHYRVNKGRATEPSPEQKEMGTGSRTVSDNTQQCDNSRSRGQSLASHRGDPGSRPNRHVRFVVDKAVFYEYFGFLRAGIAQSV